VQECSFTNGFSKNAFVEFVANTLFTDEAGVTRGDIVNCHNTHIWMNDNPHTTLASRHQHRFSINIWVGILHVQLLEPVALPNRPTVALDYLFLVNDFSVLLEHVPSHQQHV
jgi:hypothetical protein